MQRARLLAALLCAVVAVAACGGGNKRSTSAGESSTSASAPTSAPSPSTGAGTTVNTAPIVTDVFPTISLPCQPVPIPVTPVTSPGQASAVLLKKVLEVGDNCVDHVVFSITSKSGNPPGYRITYGTPPFTQDASGAPVAVRGSAFVVVRMEPAYGYDFENGRATYTGSKRIVPSNAKHVTEIVETGDFEGVLTWVIGLDSKRPFSVEATGDQLAVTIS